MGICGLSVSQAYIDRKKARLQANFRVLAGFLRFLWNAEMA